MTTDEGFRRLLDVLRAVPDLRLRQPLEKLQPTHLFRQDLGFDSLALISLFMELQEIFPHIEEEEVARWKCLQDCVESMIRA